MSPNTETHNPFALMTAPEAIFAAIERSERLARLKSTICRPLDKPRPEKPVTDLKAFDDEIESIEIIEPEEIVEPIQVGPWIDDEAESVEIIEQEEIMEPAQATEWESMSSLVD